MKPKKPDDYVIIIGCGRLGANLANTLSENDKSVLVVDKDKSSFRKLAPSFGGMQLEGDGTDLSVLYDAQITNASAVIAVTNYDNTNIMAAQIAKEIFHIDTVIARLYDQDCECVYQEFGIDTICPAVLSSKEIDKLLKDTGGLGRAAI
ncbi:MAG: TrkA family potassium uptake protein [Clostridiales bacterium]|jgi:trk system potassium uptake protein TrkA|nr:TrkA family potassium uptake protein [Clostridiales bacterium]